MTLSQASQHRSADRQSLLIEASERLAAAGSMEAVVDVLRETAREAIGAEGIAVVLREGDTCRYIAEDAMAALWRGRRFDVGECVSGWSMTRLETVSIADVAVDPRIPQDAYAPTFVRSMAVAPIGRPEAVAALGAYWSTVGTPDEASVARLEGLARLAGIAIQNARLFALSERDARLKALMLAAGRMGTWSFDAATGVLDASATCRSNFGRDPALPFTYDDLHAAIHPEDRARVNEAIAVSLDSGCDYDVEYRVVTPSGEVRWIGIRGQPGMGDDGRPIGLAGVSIDITERKRMEEALRTSAATLEHLVEERTRELVRTQEALRQSQKLEAMGQLTGGVAHDFNNLLTPIVGSLDMLQRRGIGGEREQRLIGGALQSADRARTLVQRLLAFARRQPLKPEPVDLAVLVTGMMELLATTLGPRVQLRLDLPPDLPMAMADPHQVEMALLNLSVNARDAMPDGGSLTITAEACGQDDTRAAGLEAGRYVVIRISDTGFGMDAETRQRAIEPFFSTKGVGQGTGLGLSMAHGLAQQLGGALQIDSELGQGTTVSMLFHETSAVLATVPPSLTAVTRAAGVALLVDDEELVRAITADMLAELGFEVVEASSGEEALARLRSDPRIRLVVTDHVMPGMTGVELARAVVALSPGLPVLVTSGYSDAAGLAPELPRIAKPFRQSDLQAALATILPMAGDEPIIATLIGDVAAP
ncbi:hybrid sensor histidine kinase/response regulator [Sphingomonas melonis]|uniref:hybrid sensor histidine kinase/response regulator n=1 Tax=Sphingomonas melonis TaxID=152682 RepID=UPI001C8CDDC3|nr:ATP-binding protein [Sphingomonas melonis]